MEFNWSFFVTIGLIFLTTFLGAYLRTRVRDRCLRDFESFHITVERSDGKLVWGVMSLEATGLELTYTDAFQDDRHIESSYALYASEYQDIQAIYRYADKLSAWGKRKRDQDIRRSFHPDMLRRLARTAGNIFSTANDSLQEVLALLLGQFQKAGKRFLAANTDATLSKLGGKFIGEIGHQADPLLENYIGQRVVFEITEDNDIHEYVGVFKDYSAYFFEFLDVQYPERQVLPFQVSEGMQTDRIHVGVQRGLLRVQNLKEEPLLLQMLSVEGQEQYLNVVVDGGETVELHPQFDATNATLHMQVARQLDMIVPRPHCVVRHRAENYRPEDVKEAMMDIIFDLGTAFTGSSRREARERSLRGELERHPKDALTAANLASILIQKDEFIEAEKLLQHALTAEDSLPDGGRRARMALRELERRKNGASVIQHTLQKTEIAAVGEYCVVCNDPIKGVGRMLGGRAYCEAHYRRILQGRSGAWRATIGLIAGVLAFVGLVSLAARALDGVLTGVALIAVGLILAAVPAVIWMLVFYFQDRLEPEPKRYIIGVFVLGAVLAGTVGQPLISSFFQVNQWATLNLETKIGADVLIVGITQAFLIYAAVRYTVFRNDEFDEPVDGVIYGAAAGLGYATLINIAYVVGHGGVDLGAGAARVAVTALAYASFGGLLGYFLGQAKFEDHTPFWLPAGVVATALLNGALTTVLGLVSRTGLQATPERGLMLASVIAAVTFAVLFAFLRGANRHIFADATG